MFSVGTRQVQQRVANTCDGIVARTMGFLPVLVKEFVAIEQTSCVQPGRARRAGAVALQKRNMGTPRGGAERGNTGSPA